VNKKNILFTLLLLCCLILKGQQNSSFSSDMIFEKYLLQNNLLNDSKTLLEQYSSAQSLSNVQKDSINYFFGKTYYLLEKPGVSANYYSRVSKESNLFPESYAMRTYLLLSIKDTADLSQPFQSFQTNDPLTNEIELFCNASASLYNSDTTTFNYFNSKYSLPNSSLTEYEKKLTEIKNSIPVYKKSGMIAGSLSALIPGLGKIYAGKPKQGLTTFIPVFILGLQAYEAYKRSGVKSPWFIADSGLFTIFYIGNILGSALSVSVKRKEIQHEVNDQILLNMHIALQKLYK